jgi:hypothetical protein
MLVAVVDMDKHLAVLVDQVLAATEHKLLVL